jgi:CRP/FNR family cyclic AMP-dependent transcriptional regulator
VRAATRNGTSFLGAGPRLTFYTRLSPAEHQGLRAIGTVHTYQHGDYLFVQGDEGDRVLVVRNGHVKIVATTGDKKAVLLGVGVAGDLVGELAFLNGGQRSASAVALGNLSVLSIGFTQFSALLSRYPRMANEVARSVSDKLRSADRRRLEFSYPVVTRVARVLCEMIANASVEVYGEAAAPSAIPGGYQGGTGADYQGQPPETGIAVAITQRELGQLVGAAEVSVQKALRRLAADGLLTPRYGRILITHPAELRRHARG